MNCPLCSSDKMEKWDSDKFRSYHRCSSCSLISVPRDQILPPELEFKRYQAHENHESDLGYRNYLQGIAQAIQAQLRMSSHGLDFGCGRTQIMKTIFKESGHEMDSYDLYFNPQESIWEKKYDFIILSEVIEHLADPRKTLLKLNSLLKAEGQFFIKTMYYPNDQTEFSRWFYKRDLTHVQFFSFDSMKKLAQDLGRVEVEDLPLKDLHVIR